MAGPMVEKEGFSQIEGKMRQYSHNLQRLRSRLDEDMQAGAHLADAGSNLADTGSTPTRDDKPEGNRVHQNWDATTLEFSNLGGDRSFSTPGSVTKKGPSTLGNGSEQVVAVRDADSNLIYSARHVYAPIAEHHAGKAFIPSIPLDKENRVTCKAPNSESTGSTVDESTYGQASNFENSWFELLTGHRPDTPTSRARREAGYGEVADQPAGWLAAEQEHRAQLAGYCEESTPAVGPVPLVDLVAAAPSAGAAAPRPYPPVVQHHSVKQLALPAVEKANGAAGRSARNAPRSKTPQPTITGDTPPVDVAGRQERRKGQAVEVPVQSIGYSRPSLGAAQRGKGANGVTVPRAGKGIPGKRTSAGGATVAPPMVQRSRALAGPGARRDQLSYSSSALPGRSVSPMDGSSRSGPVVSRMGSSPSQVTCGSSQGGSAAAPSSPPRFAPSSAPSSPMLGHSPLRTRPRSDLSPCPTSPNLVHRASSSSYAPPASPRSVDRRVPSYVPPLQPQPQPWNPAAFGAMQAMLSPSYPAGVGSPFSASCPVLTPPPMMAPTPPQSPLGSQVQIRGGYGPPTPPASGNMYPGPATDPNFLRHSFGGGMPSMGPTMGQPPAPIPLRPPMGVIHHPMAPVPPMPLACRPASNFTAEDHALIGRGLNWAPVRGEARGILGAEYTGQSRPSTPLIERPGSPFGSVAASLPHGLGSPFASVSGPAMHGSPHGSASSPALPLNYAYPSSPPAGLRHYDVSKAAATAAAAAPASPPPASRDHMSQQQPWSPPASRDSRGQQPRSPPANQQRRQHSPMPHGGRGSSPLPPPPPLQRTEPDLAVRQPEPGWAAVVENHKEPSRRLSTSAPGLPRVGESMVCSSPQLPGVSATKPNLQATAPNLQECASMVLDQQHQRRKYPESPNKESTICRRKYPESPNKESMWLRAPFGTQHQVSKIPG